MAERGAIHHLELWVADLDQARDSWGWLLGQLGYVRADQWAAGASWRLRESYVVLEAGPDVAGDPHDRHRPGLNHLAFHAGTRHQLDALVDAAPAHGWTLMFPDHHPYAGGADHYAAYLENGAGFEVELVADES